ncbi:MAG: hypothetical protein ACFE9C_01370 [Candidatus Hodarchaeota archaeon]
MTNLIEKSLLLGFGIFTLTIFSSIIIPFLSTLADFNQNGRHNIETYIFFINEIDQGINYVAQNPDDVYLKNIDYPSDLNISFYDNLARYSFFVENQLCVKINEYNIFFFNQDFCQISPGIYQLNISHYSTTIKVNFNNLN